jgi:hypothetical protein
MVKGWKAKRLDYRPDLVILDHTLMDVNTLPMRRDPLVFSDEKRNSGAEFRGPRCNVSASSRKGRKVAF